MMPFKITKLLCLLIVFPGVVFSEELVTLLKEEVSADALKNISSRKQMLCHLVYSGNGDKYLLWTMARPIHTEFKGGPSTKIHLLGYEITDDYLYVVYTDLDSILIDKIYNNSGLWQLFDTELVHKGPVPLFISPPEVEINIGENELVYLKFYYSHPPSKGIKFSVDFQKSKSARVGE